MTTQLATPTPSTPNVDPNADLESLSADALVTLKFDLIRESNGNAGRLSDEKLVRLCRIFTLLRKRSSGPPKNKLPTTASKSASELL